MLYTRISSQLEAAVIPLIMIAPLGEGALTWQLTSTVAHMVNFLSISYSSPAEQRLIHRCNRKWEQGKPKFAYFWTIFIDTYTQPYNKAPSGITEIVIVYFFRFQGPSIFYLCSDAIWFVGADLGKNRRKTTWWTFNNVLQLSYIKIWHILISNLELPQITRSKVSGF